MFRNQLWIKSSVAVLSTTILTFAGSTKALTFTGHFGLENLPQQASENFRDGQTINQSEKYQNQIAQTIIQNINSNNIQIKETSNGNINIGDVTTNSGDITNNIQVDNNNTINNGGIRNDISGDIMELDIAVDTIDIDTPGEMIELDISGDMIDIDTPGEMIELDISGDMIDIDTPGEIMELDISGDMIDIRNNTSCTINGGINACGSGGDFNF